MIKDLLKQYLKDLIKRPFYAIYERRLSRKAKTWSLPKHIGIIMDGNRRFARDSKWGKIIDGHEQGADKLREVLDWIYDFHIPVITVWSFSLDNFDRSLEEVEDLMKLIERRTKGVVHDEEVHKNKIKVRFIGQRDKLPQSLQDAIQHTEQVTGNYDQYVLNVAVAYGGREEIMDALRQYVKDNAKNGRNTEDVIDSMQAKDIESYLYTSGQPDPDLIIRTSGEVRLSGFLLWQSAYSEYYFCDTHWPIFRKIDLLRALRAYHVRQRRYGK